MHSAPCPSLPQSQTEAKAVTDADRELRLLAAQADKRRMSCWAAELIDSSKKCDGVALVERPDKGAAEPIREKAAARAVLRQPRSSRLDGIGSKIYAHKVGAGRAHARPHTYNRAAEASLIRNRCVRDYAVMAADAVAHFGPQAPLARVTQTFLDERAQLPRRGYVAKAAQGVATARDNEGRAPVVFLPGEAKLGNRTRFPSITVQSVPSETFGHRGEDGVAVIEADVGKDRERHIFRSLPRGSEHGRGPERKRPPARLLGWAIGLSVTGGGPEGREQQNYDTQGLSFSNTVSTDVSGAVAKLNVEFTKRPSARPEVHAHSAPGPINQSPHAPNFKSAFQRAILPTPGAEA